MKSQAAKSHLYISEESPRIEQQPCLKAICGRWMNHPQCVIEWAPLFIAGEGLPIFNSLRTCANCIKRAEAYQRNEDGTLTTTRFYIAAIVDGQTTKVEEEI